MGYSEKAYNTATLDKMVIDRKAALDRTMGDEQFLLDLLQEFVKGLPDIWKKIKNAIVYQNVSVVAKEANRLAGAAENLGAMNLSNAAFGLGKLGRSGNIEKLYDAYKRLLMEADIFVSHVNAYEFRNVLDGAVS